MSATTDRYDTLEDRDPERREAALMNALPAQVARARATPSMADRH